MTPAPIPYASRAVGPRPVAASTAPSTVPRPMPALSSMFIPARIASRFSAVAPSTASACRAAAEVDWAMPKATAATANPAAESVIA